MTHYSNHHEDLNDYDTTHDMRRSTTTALVENMNIKTNLGTLLGFTLAMLTLLITLLNCYSSLKTDVALVMQEVRALKVENEKLTDLVMQLYADKRVAKTNSKSVHP